MSTYLKVHPTHPQPRLIEQAAAHLRRGDVLVYPTDSCYALGCHIGDKEALLKICRIRGIDEGHNFTLMCRDLSEIATYARVDNRAYRLLRANTPGPYTFVLPATREVPRRLQHARRKTIGIRVPDHPITQALLKIHDEPILSSTLTLPGAESPLLEPETVREILSGQVDLILDGGYCGDVPTTVIDLTQGEPVILRSGRGDITPFLVG